MMVDVTSNYISDFSFLFDCFHCQLTLVGISQQKTKDAPYFDVYQLYADVNEDGSPKVCYRGYTNQEGSTIECGGLQAAATLDGNTYEVAIPGNPTQTMKVSLVNGEFADSTRVILPTIYDVNDGEQITINTGLPASYRIGNLRAEYGTVSTTVNAVTNGLDIVYQAPAEAVDDIVYLSYYEGNRLRGFAQLNVGKVLLLGDVNADGSVTPADAIMILYHYFNVTQSGFKAAPADLNRDGNISPSDAIEALYKFFGAGSGKAPQMFKELREIVEPQ